MPSPIALLALLLSTALPACLGVYDFGPLIRQPGHQANGFPKWYRDDSGRKCQPCLHYEPSAATTISPCLSTVVAPLQPDEAPDGFFYYSLSAQIPDPTTGKPAILWETGVEGAYAVGPVIQGDQMVFQRNRMLIHCPAQAPDTSKGQSYKFYITTPYDRPDEGFHVFPQPLESTVGGRRCIFHTIDVGAVAQEFAANLKGPVDSFGVFFDPPQSQAYTPGPDQPPQTYRQYGNFPAGGGVTLHGKTVALEVRSNAWRANPFDDIAIDPAGTTTPDYMSTQVLVSSCEAYEGAALRAESATLVTIEGIHYVDVTVTCDPNMMVTVRDNSGWSGMLIADAAPNFAPRTPSTFTNENKPTLYSARLRLPSLPNGSLQLSVLANGVIEDTVVALPRLSGTATYASTTKTITVDVTATSATMSGISVGTFNVRGEYTRIGMASDPKAASHSVTVGGISAVPELIWACQAQLESMKECVPISVNGNVLSFPPPPPSTPPPPPPDQTLAVTAGATPTTFFLGIDKQISLQVTGAPSDCTVTWTSSPAIATITANGVNTASATVPSTADKGTITFTATVQCSWSRTASSTVQVQLQEANLQVNWQWDTNIQAANNIYAGVPFFINPTYTYGPSPGMPLPANSVISSFVFKLNGLSNTCWNATAAPWTTTTAVKCIADWSMNAGVGATTLTGSVQLDTGATSSTKTDSTLTVKEDTVVTTSARLTLPNKSKTNQYEFRVVASSNDAVALGARVTCQANYYNAANVLQFTLSGCVCDTVRCSANPLYATWPGAKAPQATDKVLIVTSALRKPASFATAAVVRLIQ